MGNPLGSSSALANLAPGRLDPLELSFLSVCQALRRENGFAKGEVKARGMALHEEGKETQFTAVFKGVGSKFLSLKSSS